MGNRNRTNPKKKPATQYDVERAWREGYVEGCTYLMSMILWVLHEDFKFSGDDLDRLQERTQYYQQELEAKRLRPEDILSALKEEHGLQVEPERKDK